jgi:hypothetical protein
VLNTLEVASGSSTVVQSLATNLEIEGSNPATTWEQENGLERKEKHIYNLFFNDV